MAWPKGVPRKKAEPVETKNRKKAEMVPSNSMESGFAEAERDAIYERFINNGAEETAETPQTEEEDVTPEIVTDEEVVAKEATEEPVTETETSETAEPSAELKTEATPEEINVDEILKSLEPKVKDEKSTTVPYGALHEEREKRKAVQRENDELRKQVEQLIADNRSFMEGNYTEDNKTERELNEIKQHIQRQEREKAALQLEREIDHVDQTLETRGFPGFKEFGRDYILGYFNRLGDPDLIQPLDNPQGWAKIFLEDVYPRISKVVKARDNAEIKSGKIEAKKQASLVTSPGKTATAAQTPQSKKSPYEEYLADRMKMRI